MMTGVSAVVVALAALLILGAPPELVALIAAMSVGQATSLLVTLRWKIAIRTAVVAGSVVILALAFGLIFLLLLGLVVLVGSARVARADFRPKRGRAT